MVWYVAVEIVVEVDARVVVELRVMLWYVVVGVRVVVVAVVVEVRVLVGAIDCLLPRLDDRILARVRGRSPRRHESTCDLSQHGWLRPGAPGFTDFQIFYNEIVVKVCAHSPCQHEFTCDL